MLMIKQHLKMDVENQAKLIMPLIHTLENLHGVAISHTVIKYGRTPLNKAK